MKQADGSEAASDVMLRGWPGSGPSQLGQGMPPLPCPVAAAGHPVCPAAERRRIRAYGRSAGIRP